MVQPIGPIRGIINTTNEAPPEQVHGYPANPYHQQAGEQAQPYPWEAWGGAWGPPQGPRGAENELLGDLPESMTFTAGTLSQDPTGDLTPYRTHAAPHIKGSNTTTDPGDEACRLQQSYEAHSTKTNAAASRQYQPTMEANQDQWTGFYNIESGETMLPDVPGQVSYQANGFGVKDRTSNTYAARNQYGFDSSHRHRRFATGMIPGNTMWMRPGSRVMVKSLPSTARLPVGPGPFQGQDTTQAFGIDGAILQDIPGEYQAPPQPYLAPAGSQVNISADVQPIALW